MSLFLAFYLRDNQMTIADKYNNCIPMLKNRTFHFSCKYDVDFDELYSVAMESFCIAYREYDKKKKIKFETWLWRNLNVDLNDYAKKFYRYEIPNTNRVLKLLNNTESFVDSTEDKIYIEQQTKKMSRKTRTILKAILYPNKNEIKIISRQNITKTTIKRYFVDCRGWTERAVEKCFKEIEVGLSLC